MIDHPFVKPDYKKMTMRQRWAANIFPPLKCAECGGHILDHPSQKIKVPAKNKD